MIVSLIILGALVTVGLILYLHDRYTSDAEEPQAQAVPPTDTDSECCGTHLVCEKAARLADVSTEIQYYDDEELDEYRGRGSEDYNDKEIEQFRDVLLTLLPTDIAGWARSLQMRQINLPVEVRDELLMMAEEAS